MAAMMTTVVKSTHPCPCRDCKDFETHFKEGQECTSFCAAYLQFERGLSGALKKSKSRSWEGA